MNVAVLLVALACTKNPELGSDTASSSNRNSTDTAAPDAPDPIEQIDETGLPQGDDPCRGPVLGTVSEIVDGDTIKAETGRGVERVRLIGVNTPEVDHSGPDDDCFGEESKAYLTAMIKGKRIWLTFDEECQDQYGRTLAYVHRGTDQHSFVQRMLLQGGWASAYAVQPNVSFRALFESDQALAQSTNEGIWGSCR